jgi:hypothetical protein
MTFELPSEAHIERCHFDDGWCDIVWVDGKARVQVGPFRYKNDVSDFMLWFIGEYASLSVAESQRSPTDVADDIGAEREELIRANRRRSGKPDLADLVRELDDEEP